MANRVDKDWNFEIRIRAVAAMKGPLHPDLLGQTSESGQAFDKTAKSRQCCLRLPWHDGLQRG
jgi:hypothetical protein